MSDNKFSQFNQEVPSIDLGILLLETKLAWLNEQDRNPGVSYLQGFETCLFGECLRGSIDQCDQLIKEHREAEVPDVLYRFGIHLTEQVHA